MKTNKRIKEINAEGMTYHNIEIKTPSDLKYWYERVNPDGYFFTRDTMKFFGDTMANFRILHHEKCIELYRYRKTKSGFTSWYFDKTNLGESETSIIE